MAKKIQEEAEKKAKAMHDKSVKQYIKQAEKEATEKARLQKIETDKAIQKAADQKAATMTKQQVAEYVKKAEKEA